MAHAHHREPPRLYSWTVLPPESDLRGSGAVGITDDRLRALERAGEALRCAPPGARGLVHQVLPSIARIAYYYDGLIARGSLDLDSGTVEWENLPVRSLWDRFIVGAVFEMPPEAVAAGLADGDTEQERAALVRILGAPGVAERCGRVGSTGGAGD